MENCKSVIIYNFYWERKEFLMFYKLRKRKYILITFFTKAKYWLNTIKKFNVLSIWIQQFIFV
jgi:hypothetical protein